MGFFTKLVHKVEKTVGNMITHPLKTAAVIAAGGPIGLAVDAGVNALGGALSGDKKSESATGGTSVLADAGLGVLGGALLGDDKKSNKSQKTASGSDTNQTVQNPIEVAKISSSAAGLPKSKVPEVLNTAKMIAPKDQKGNPQLTINSITTAANMVANLRNSTNSYFQENPTNSIKLHYQG